MARPDPSRVAEAHLRKTAFTKRTAGEVRFVKDRGGDTSEWAWNTHGPSAREITNDFVFNARFLKPLAEVLRSSLMALGHATSAHSRLVKIKSRNVSPDGNLGGKGYIQKIPDMRRQLMNCVEVLSSMSDTLYDELQAPHWNASEDTLDPRDRDEVREIVEDAAEIKEDPEGWAKEEEAEESPNGKTASIQLQCRGLEGNLRYASNLLDRITASLPVMQGTDGPKVAELAPLLARDLREVSRTLCFVENSDV